jgi:hypothetical protein
MRHVVAFVVAVVVVLAVAVAGQDVDGTRTDDDKKPSDVTRDGDGKSWITVTNGVEVHLEGDSGKIRVRRRTMGVKDAVEIYLDEITELDTTNKAIGSADTAKLTWGMPTYSLVNGVNTTTMRATGVYKNGATVTLQAALYQRDTVVPWGDSSFTVPRNRVKFSLFINNWPFASNASRLQADLEIKVSGKGYKPDNFENDSDVRIKKVKLAARGSLDIVTTAIVDGVTKPITYAIRGDGTKAGLLLTFPYFSSSLAYDPTIGVTSGAQSLTASVALGLVVAAVASLLA